MAIYYNTDAFIVWANRYSKIFSENIGTGEGSVLGPTMFRIMYNDIVEYLGTPEYQLCIFIGSLVAVCLLFADDTALFSTSWRECQSSFGKYVQYVLDNGLKMNASKTVGMVCRWNDRKAKVIEGVLYSRNARSQFEKRELSTGSGQVKFVHKFKYLGIIFNEWGTWETARENALAGGRRALYIVTGTLMSLEYISYEYAMILYDSLVYYILTYGCELWTLVTRHLTPNTPHDAMQREVLRKELGVTKLCPTPLLHFYTNRDPISYQMWRRRVAFFINMINAPVDSTAMQALIELSDLEASNYVSNTWLSDTMSIIKVLDPTAQHRVRYVGNKRVFQVEGDGIVRSFHCSKAWDPGKHYWTPKHAADDRYRIVKMHAATVSKCCFNIIIKKYHDDMLNTITQQASGPRYAITHMVHKHAKFTPTQILSQPYKRSYRQALAKLLTGDMMIGRITKHWFLKPQDRVPGLPGGCIECYKHRNTSVIESEEHLVFDCISTKKYRAYFWKSLSEQDAHRCWNRSQLSRFETLVSTDNLATWALLGGISYKIWSRPCQAWRKHQNI